MMRCAQTLFDLDRLASFRLSAVGEGSLAVAAVGRPRKLVIGPKKAFLGRSRRDKEEEILANSEKSTSSHLTIW